MSKISSVISSLAVCNLCVYNISETKRKNLDGGIIIVNSVPITDDAAVVLI